MSNERPGTRFILIGIKSGDRGIVYGQYAVIPPNITY